MQTFSTVETSELSSERWLRAKLNSLCAPLSGLCDTAALMPKCLHMQTCKVAASRVVGER